MSEQAYCCTMANTPIWDLAPHTRAKHQLLRAYLDAWVPILGQSQHKRLLFVDGFAGPGVYSKGEPGSPIVALEAVAQSAVDASSCEFVMLFVEENSERVESLESEIAKFRDSSRPLPNIATHVVHGEFADIATDLLGTLDENGAKLAPTLAMIDPFGFSGVPMSLIKDLLRFPSCEIFFNLMLNHINWHVTTESVSEHMEALFGTDEFREVPPAGDPQRQPFLIDLYARQLQTEAGFQHVSSFQLVNEAGRPNVILHGTRHIKGLEVMRRAMWNLDPSQGTRFDARDDPNVGSLFDLDVDTTELQALIYKEFEGRTVPISTIHEFTLVSSRFDPTRHLKVKTLKVMEKAGLIADVQKADGSARRAGTFPAACTIRFS